MFLQGASLSTDDRQTKTSTKLERPEDTLHLPCRARQDWIPHEKAQ